ncbi:hypothetical protein B0H14DRAFT_3866571 [Mycena olivaceomarginata]|nr:hypothetical protein B0H14DRAFT_3866571 [Mycena olivaceomarginata]
MRFSKFVLSALTLFAMAAAAPADVGHAGTTTFNDEPVTHNGLATRWTITFTFSISFRKPGLIEREFRTLDMPCEAYKCYTHTEIVEFLGNYGYSMGQVTGMAVSEKYKLESYSTETCTGDLMGDWHSANGFKAYPLST